MAFTGNCSLGHVESDGWAHVNHREEMFVRTMLQKIHSYSATFVPNRSRAQTV